MAVTILARVASLVMKRPFAAAFTLLLGVLLSLAPLREPAPSA
jgi:hypothetical protein